MSEVIFLCEILLAQQQNEFDSVFGTKDEPS